MQKAPALIGLCSRPRLSFSTPRLLSMSTVMKTQENRILIQQAMRLVPLKYSP